MTDLLTDQRLAHERYGVILADPPWSYNNGGNGRARAHYPPMTDRELMDLGPTVAALSCTDCVLLMWATWPKLDVALALIEPWGFRYKSGLPWIKLKEQLATDLFSGEIDPIASFGTGFWVRACSEPLLIAARGEAKHPEDAMLGLLGPSVRHSRKPDCVHTFAEQWPGPYLEMFARRKRAGWDVYGDEVDGVLLEEMK